MTPDTEQLIERLRDIANSSFAFGSEKSALRKAADRIQSDHAQIAEMKEALIDAAAYMRGDIQGTAQRDGILREIDALTSGEMGDCQLRPARNAALEEALGTSAAIFRDIVNASWLPDSWKGVVAERIRLNDAALKANRSEP